MTVKKDSHQHHNTLSHNVQIITPEIDFVGGLLELRIHTKLMFHPLIWYITMESNFQIQFTV